MVHRYNKDTQKKILHEANHLFMSKGYLGTSTREIAKNAGITQPNLYHYFSDKEKLYQAVLEQHLKTVGDDLRKIAATGADDFQQTLTKMAEYLIETHLIDLFMMLHDLKLNLSAETRNHLFCLWKKNYREPFEKIFANHQQLLVLSCNSWPDFWNCWHGWHLERQEKWQGPCDRSYRDLRCVGCGGAWNAEYVQCRIGQCYLFCSYHFNKHFFRW